MEDISRQFFVFYNKNNELYQVALSDDETELVALTIQSLHDGKIKILPNKFGNIELLKKEN